MANVLEYTDIRAFLQASFDEAKAKNPRWSLRSWAMKLKLSGPSGLAMVLNGQRNIGNQLASKLAGYYKFNSEEKKHFQSLVRLGSGGASASLIAMMSRPAPGSDEPGPIDDKLPRDVVLAHRWYFYAIREMTLLEGFEPSARWIAAHLKYKVSHDEIEAVLASLLRQGFLAKDGAGRLRPAPGRIESGGTETARLAMRFHDEVLDLARRAVTQDPPEERGLFSSTITIPKSELPAAKEAIRKFRAEFEKRFEKSPADTTMQLNIQIFSVAESGK